MPAFFKKIDVKVLLAFAAIYIIWGTTYLAIKIGLEHMHPFIMAAFRYFIAGALLLLFCTIKKETVFTKRALRNMLLGAFMLTLGQGVLFWAEQYISSGLTAVFGSTLPVIYILTDRRNWRGYFNNKLTFISILMGFTGILILFWGQISLHQQYPAQTRIIASVVAVVSCICWAGGSLYYKYHLTSGSLFCNVGWQLMGGTVTCVLVSLLTGEWKNFSLSAVPVNTWLAVLYLAIAGSIIAFSALYYLLATRPAAVVGTYAYVNPIIAVLLGCLLAGESITISQIIGIITILVAAYLANKVKFNAEGAV